MRTKDYPFLKLEAVECAAAWFPHLEALNYKERQLKALRKK